MYLEPVVAPLEGLKVEAAGQGATFAVAAWLLGGMGASIVAPNQHDDGTADTRIMPAGPSKTTGCGSTLIPSPVRLDDAGLPEGCLSYATGLALACGAIAGWLSGRSIGVDEVAVALEIRLPDVIAASYGTANPMRPHPPRRAPGGGFYHADLGAPGAAEDFESLVGTLEPGASASVLAAACQEWRLAVCDYRHRKSGPALDPARDPVKDRGTDRAKEPGTDPSGDLETHGSVLRQPIRFGRTPPEADMAHASRVAARRHLPGEGLGIAVLDMTAMWAGPLATRLLQQLGSEITKVEPSFRPDGTRALRGGGIYPGGEHLDPGRDSGMWNALNWSKRHVDLDLRNPTHMRRFVALARHCDVVIESFSPRVASNFDLAARIGKGPLMVSIPAFGLGPQRDWVAYGTGVHAQSGLGHIGLGHIGFSADGPDMPGDDRFCEPAVSYPDPLAGLTATLGVLAGLASKALGARVDRVEVSLDEAIQPLASEVGKLLSGLPSGVPVDRDRPPSLLRGADNEGERLLNLALDLGLMVPRQVGGRWLAHPSGPFSFQG